MAIRNEGGCFWDDGKVWPELVVADIRVENHDTSAHVFGLTDGGKAFLNAIAERRLAVDRRYALDRATQSAGDHQGCRGEQPERGDRVKRSRNAQQSVQTLTLKQLLTGPIVQTHRGVVFARISTQGGVTIVSNAPWGPPQNVSKPDSE